MTSPEAEPPLWPEMEPETEPEGVPEVEPEGEPEIEPPMAEGMNFSGGRPWYLRPDPNWRQLEETLGVVWPLHTYTLGLLFAILALISIYHIVRLSSMRRSLAKPYYLTLQCLLLVCGITRTVHFFADPYFSRRRVPLAIAFITLHTFDPCMLSAFILVFVTLFKVTRLRLVSRGLFHPLPLAIIIIFSFLVSLTADIIVAHARDQGTILYMFICQLYFVIMGLVSSAFYGYLFCRIFNRIFMTRVKINRMTRRKSAKKEIDEKTKGEESKKGDYSGYVYNLHSTPVLDSEDTILDDSMGAKSHPQKMELIPAHCKQDIVCDVSTSGTDLQTTATQDESSVLKSPDSGICISPKNDVNTCQNTPLCSPPGKGNASDCRKTIPAKKPPRRRLFDLKNPDDIVEARVPLIAKLVLLAALIFLLSSFCNFLTIIMAAGHVAENEDGIPSPWFWWGYQTIMRVLEIGMVAVIVVISATPLYGKRKNPSPDC